MKYLQPSFSTSAPNDQDYRDRWEATFRKGPEIGPVAPPLQTLTEMVKEFHTVFGQPVLDKPTVPDRERVNLRLKLIAEEFFELLEACDVDHGMYYDPSRMCVIGDVDLVDTADALADLAYVIEGMNLEFGIDSAAVLAEVHANNLSKLGPGGKPIYNESGKVIKPTTWTPPDVAKVLNVGR